MLLQAHALEDCRSLRVGRPQPCDLAARLGGALRAGAAARLGDFFSVLRLLPLLASGAVASVGRLLAIRLRAAVSSSVAAASLGSARDGNGSDRSCERA